VNQQADSWSNGADILNERIADGVIAANVTEPPSELPDAHPKSGDESRFDL
jgi:hypothetical protein